MRRAPSVEVDWGCDAVEAAPVRVDYLAVDNSRVRFGSCCDLHQKYTYRSH